MRFAGRGLLRLWRVGGVTVLADEAHKEAMVALAPEGENRVVITRDGHDYDCHGAFLSFVVTMTVSHWGGKSQVLKELK